MDAATHGRSQSVDILLEAGADLRAESTTGENALTCAVRRRYARLALLLLDRGCPLGSWKGSEDELRDWLEGEIAAGRSRD